MEFIQLANAVHNKMKEMLKCKKLYVSQAEGDIWETYLNSIPEEHNPIYLVNREYDCNCCKAFIRRAGCVVSLNEDLSFDSIWNVQVSDPVAQNVADTLHKFVMNTTELKLFVTSEHFIGTDKSLRQLEDGQVVEFNHFHSPEIPQRHIRDKYDIGGAKGTFDSNVAVFVRALEEFTCDAVQQVMDLIKEDTLYRGEQHKNTLSKFMEVQNSVTWERVSRFNNNIHYCAYIIAIKAMERKDIGNAVTHIRNTSIGTLLIDLSEGMDLEQAVRRYEAVVAPTNYQRPKALVTKNMVDDARKSIQDLGLLPAFNRRHAKLLDLNVKDLLFVDRSSVVDDGDMFDMIETKAVNDPKNAQEINIKDFIEKVLPTCQKVEVKANRSHVANMFNLTTEVEENSPSIFKWNNPFAWNYKGGVTDSIRERVKKAGGVVDAPVCIRLAWDYTDDLDLHLEGGRGFRVWYRCRSCKGFQLDVDANGGDGIMDEPVENIFISDMSKTWASNEYEIIVHNFSKRDAIAKGFELEVVIDGVSNFISYDKVVRDGERIIVGKLFCENHVYTFEPILPTSQNIKVIDSITVGDFTSVMAVSMSPNYWDGGEGIGNPHYFFYMKGYRTEENVRAIYNEFLRDDLHNHRKVLEILGNKTSIAPEGEQLGGLGFSASVRNNIIVRVTSEGKQRIYDVKF